MLMPSIYGESLFDDFFDDFPFFNDRDLKRAEKKLYGSKAGRMMSTDIKEKEDSYELNMDLPGFCKDDIKVTLDNGYLTIAAAKCSDKHAKDEEDCKYLRRERYCGSCNRSFYVGNQLTRDDIKAEFKHGILTLCIPKREEKKISEEQKLIEIKG